MSEQRFNKNLVRSILLGLAALLVGLLGNSFFSAKDEKAETPISFRSKVVETTEANPSAIPISVAVSGRLQASNRMEIFAEVTGILKNGNFNTGQAFAQGQTVANVDDSEYRAQLTAARSSFMGILSQSLADIAVDYPADAHKWENFLHKIQPTENMPALPRIDNVQLKQFLSGRNILSNYYTIQSQEVRLTKYHIKAPYTGVLSEAAIDPGTLVRVGQKMGTFVQLGTYELEASVSRSSLAFLQQGNKVGLYAADLEQEYMGTVSRINTTINATTQMVSVYFTVSGEKLKEGMYLEATIEAGSANNALEIDRNTLINGNSIYTIGLDSALVLTPITVVKFAKDKAIVTGISAGTLLPLVQISGAFEGMKVVPQDGK